MWTAAASSLPGKVTCCLFRLERGKFESLLLYDNDILVFCKFWYPRIFLFCKQIKIDFFVSMHVRIVSKVGMSRVERFDIGSWVKMKKIKLRLESPPGLLEFQLSSALKKALRTSCQFSYGILEKVKNRTIIGSLVST